MEPNLEACDKRPRPNRRGQAGVCPDPAGAAARTTKPNGLAVTDQLEGLRRENDELKSEIAVLKAGGTPLLPTHSTSIDLGAPSPAPAEGITLAPVQRSEEPSSGIQEAPEEAQPVPAAHSEVRTHTVARGDTLFSLAQKYYGNRSKWRTILAANHEVLPNESSPLKIGMTLNIP